MVVAETEMLDDTEMLAGTEILGETAQSKSGVMKSQDGANVFPLFIFYIFQCFFP